MARRAEASPYWLEQASVQPGLVVQDFLSLLGGRVLPASFFLMVALSRLLQLSIFAAQPRVQGDWLLSVGFYASCVHQAAAIAFLGMVVACFVIRRSPRRAARNPVQIAVALLGSFLMTGAAMAPQTPSAPQVTVVAALIMVAGSAFTAVALKFLGRSFSITPEARQLVTGGLYGHVRHPMYLGEMLGSFGLILQALSPFTVVIFVAFCLMQIKRMDYEEGVLQQVFPAYDSYKARTARLLPGIY